MRLFILLVCLSMLNPSWIQAEPIDLERPNIIYISIDGVNRDTLYALIEKKKLPFLQKIIKKGNVRNLSIQTDTPTETRYAYSKLLTGNKWINPDQTTVTQIPRGQTIFELVKATRPQTYIACIFSTPQNRDNPTTLKPFFNLMSPSLSFDVPEIERSATEVIQLASSFVKQVSTPYFLFFNLTDVEYIGHRYREGSLRYSEALQACDTALSNLYQSMTFKQRKQTTFIITTNYGFHKKSQSHNQNPNSWIISSEPIRYKGNQVDIVPTILRLLQINPKIPLRLAGKKLVY